MPVEIRPRAAIEADLRNVPRLRAQHMGAATMLDGHVDRLLDELWAVLPEQRRTELHAANRAAAAAVPAGPVVARCHHCGTLPDARRVTPPGSRTVVLALCDCDHLRCPHPGCRKVVRATAADLPHTCPHCKGRL